MQRRNFVRFLLGVTATVLLVPLNVLAALWNKAAFQSTTLSGALQAMDIGAETDSADIQIIVPEIAENGAIVQVEVTSRIPNTEAIAIVVEHNPTPLIANFMFSNGAEPFVVTRIKMAETSDVQAIIKVGNQYFKASKRVEVLENGCN
ncbi:MAG TPA: thiosulfate oxidation carrier protein SoxY [Methylophilaceae bacterium]